MTRTSYSVLHILAQWSLAELVAWLDLVLGVVKTRQLTQGDEAQ